ncbi:MAG: SRPBCC domain-containing protein [Nannocystis sp.]|nr:SRPBCC domain-containing protein [Nannocystis sp.]MBA3548265.1 SRPBCC domain-containing protein [Nannocystis sp.]
MSERAASESGANPGRPAAHATVDIAAPMATVWQVMIDLDAYGEWNPFVVRVERGLGAVAPGSRLKLHVRWHDGGEATSGELVTALEPPGAGRALLAYRFTGWLDRLGLVHALRTQTLVPAAGGTRYESHEAFSGALARAVPIARVREGFRRHAAALKARAEALASR